MSTDNNDTDTEQYFDTPPPKPQVGSPTSAAADLATLITALKSIPSDQLKILLQAVQPTDASSPGDASPPKDETSIPTANEYVSLIGGYLDAERKIAFCGGKPNLDYTLPQVLEDDPLAKHIPKTPACHRDLTMKPNADLSYEAADKMKAELRAYKLTDVSFQDVHHFGAKFLNTERQLHNGKRWDHSLGLIFIRELSKCPSEVMRVTFIGIGERYDTALREINPLSYDEQRSRMFSLNVHISQLVERADDLYAQIKAVDGGWPPLVNIVDKKAPDINSLTKLSHAEQAALISSGQVDINNLVQSKVKELRTKDKKQLEAYKKRFAKQSPTGDTKAPNTTPSGDSTKTAEKRAERPLPAWRTKPPAANNKDEVKEVGKYKFQWCDKCSKWVWNHTSATHKSKSPEANNFILADSSNVFEEFTDYAPFADSQE
ncbi:hypothetical protein MPSEU_000449500 [Mayamaea pseudoterrestris]|nr:hypothetical protein MPSEU_000449500 [Mayamaea pseudoterrestris]